MKTKKGRNQRPESQQRRNMEETNCLTTRDLALHFCISERQTSKLARIGYLPGIRIGKLWRFRKDVMEEWERNRMSTSEIENLAQEILKGD